MKRLCPTLALLCLSAATINLLFLDAPDYAACWGTAALLSALGIETVQ